MLPSLLCDLDRGSVARPASTERRLEFGLGGVDDCRTRPFVVGCCCGRCCAWFCGGVGEEPFDVKFSVLAARCGEARNGILDFAVGACLQPVCAADILGEAVPFVLAGDAEGDADDAQLSSADAALSMSCVRSPESGLSGGDTFQAVPNSSGCGVTPPVLAILRGEHLREPGALPNSPSEVSLLLSAGAPQPPLELVESSLQCDIRDGVMSRSWSLSELLCGRPRWDISGDVLP